MLDLPGLSRPLRRHAHKTLGKKAKTHERRSRRLRRESSLLRSAGASSLQDGTTGPLLPRIQEVYHVCLSGFPAMPSLVLILYPGQLYGCIFDFYLCLSRRSLLSLSFSTVDHQDIGLHPGSSCQCTPDASVRIWKGGYRR